ncbi:MAG TPA: alpha/beta hydrolase [Verrucomicrobiae bacterium]|nr:alpha/beta hydrolase [Verrucomicrobiae bacterium]
MAGTYSNQVAGVVLFAPYNRLTDVGQYHMPFLPVKLILVDRYPSEDFLRTYHGPVGMLVAGADNVVPKKFGQRLYDGYQAPKQIWEFPADNHWSVTERPPEFWKEVIAFWQANPR